MSRDSSRTHLHLHASHHAQLFEDFTSPLLPSSSKNLSVPSHAPTVSSHPTSTQAQLYTTNLQPGLTTQHPTSYLGTNSSAGLGHEDILVPPHLLPPNPEDEDDVVPDQHAAFGIVRAMRGAQGGQGERWRDFGGLEALVRGSEGREGREAVVGAARLAGSRIGGLR